jgi:hypothetical protein
MTAKHIITQNSGLTYGLQPTFSTATNTYTALRAEGIKFTPGINMLAANYQKPEDCRGPDADIVGGKSGTLTFNVPVRAGAGSGAPFCLLGQYCGSNMRSISVATAHVTGGTSTTFTMTTANANAHGIVASTHIGAAVFMSPTTGDNSIRFITRISVATSVMTVTVNRAWNHNPVNGDWLRGIDTLMPTTSEPSKYISWRNYVGEGATDKLLWTANGCAATWKIASVEAGAIPMATFDYQVDNWTNADTAASTAVKAADTFNPAKPVLGDALFLEGTQTDVKSIEFDPGLSLVPMASTYGTHGRSGWYYTGTVPVVNFTPYHDDDLIDAWEAATQKSVLFESLDSTTGWALWIPETQITAYDLADDEGLARGALTLKAIDPGTNADSVSYPLWAIAVTK